MKMNTFYRYIIALSLIFIVGAGNLQAGNKDRSGQAGAAELLINPWARSSGWGNAGMSGIKGLESTWSNVGGLAFTKRQSSSLPIQHGSKEPMSTSILLGFPKK
jgi:hypothetical protein